MTDAFPSAHIKAAELLSPQAAARFPAATQDIVRGAFADALHVVFVAALVIALLGMLTVALMPGGKPTAIRDAARGETLGEAMLPDGETILVAGRMPRHPTRTECHLRGEPSTTTHRSVSSPRPSGLRSTGRG